MVVEFIIRSSDDHEFTIMQTTFKAVPGVMAVALGVLLLVGLAQAAEPMPSRWVASWTASPQPVWSPDFLFPSKVPAVLRDQTVRQVVRVSLGGSRLRIVLSNIYGRQPLVVGGATVGLAAEEGAVVTASVRKVTFGGRTTATIAPGAPLLSDPVDLPVPALAKLSVSLYLPQPTPVTTFHWDGRQTAWIVAGDQVTAAGLKADAQTTTARLLLAGVEVEAAASAWAVAAIGDSITDGASASLDADTRWPDFLAARLAPQGVAVINAGISGGRLLADGMGVNALARLDRDVLAQPGVRSVLVLLGINDISWPGTAFAPDAELPTLDALVAGYRQLIARVRARGLRAIGATLTPFRGALPGTPLADYYAPDKDALRRQLNAWIRASGAFDAVVDFDAALRDPDDPSRLMPRFDSGDHLHPGDVGNRAMAEAVALDVLRSGLDVTASPSKSALEP
jgi:lysophospholipase L1-like esterase